MSSPELRWDPLAHRWVVIAHQRGDRPNEFAPIRYHRQAAACPFCRGHETETPPAVASYPAEGDASTTASWQVRVVPNKFPAVHAFLPAHPTLPISLGEAGHSRVSPAAEAQAHAPWRFAEARGIHEVIIESPKHVTSLTALSTDEVQLALQAYQDRLRAASDCPEIRYGQLFKNVGPAAGASIEHTHCQLLALTVVPGDVDLRRLRQVEYLEETRHCLVCDLVAAEQTDGRRVIQQRDGFLAYCPYASRFPGEIWIVSQTHCPDFRQLNSIRMAGLARLLRETLGRLESAFPEVAYNLVLQSRPFGAEPDEAFHWQLQILPRLAQFAGFEWGTGCFINPLPPESAARILRSSEC